MWKIYLHIKLPGGLLNKQKSVHKIPLRQMDIWWILNPIVIHSLHISWSSWVCIRGSECVRVCLFLCACLCLCVCVCYVGKRVWTSQRYCWRFSARPSGGGGEGQREGGGVVRRSLRRSRRSHCLSFLSSRAPTPGSLGCTCAAWQRPRSLANRCTCTIPPCWCTARSDTRAPCRWCPHTR